jgi:hypothetical protein
MKKSPEYLQALVDINYSPIDYIQNNSSIPSTKTDEYIGYKLITTEDEIMVAIDDYKQCCETYGVTLAVHKDLDSKNLQHFTDFFSNPGNQSIQILSNNYISYNDDTNLLLSLRPIISRRAINNDFSDIYEHNWGCIQVNTNHGTLYLIAWECHNGYYSHNAQLVCSEFKYDINL